jgi:hypothetical protein
VTTTVAAAWSTAGSAATIVKWAAARSRASRTAAATTMAGGSSRCRGARRATRHGPRSRRGAPGATQDGGAMWTRERRSPSRRARWGARRGWSARRAPPSCRGGGGGGVVMGSPRGGGSPRAAARRCSTAVPVVPLRLHRTAVAAPERIARWRGHDAGGSRGGGGGHMMVR